MHDWKDTVLLPRTDFPMKANLAVTEPAMIDRWRAMDLYGLIRRRRAGAVKFVLHDGPPYANGDVHLGTALNKILKDLVVKTRTMAGFDAPYVPGWDCHGLPIELNVEKELGAAAKDRSCNAAATSRTRVDSRRLPSSDSCPPPARSPTSSTGPSNLYPIPRTDAISGRSADPDVSLVRSREMAMRAALI